MRIIKRPDGTISLSKTRIERMIDQAEKEAKETKNGFLDLGPIIRAVHERQKREEPLAIPEK